MIRKKSRQKTFIATKICCDFTHRDRNVIVLKNTARGSAMSTENEYENNVVEGDEIGDDFALPETFNGELELPHQRRRVVERNEKLLTPAEVTFIQHYMETGKVSAAKEAAGFKPGSNVHKRRHVVARVNELFDDAITQSGITPEKVILELGRIAFANSDDFLDDDLRPIRHKVSRARMAAVSGVEIDMIHNGEDEPPVERVKFKMYDKMKALDLLGRHFSLFTDVKVTLDVSDRLQRAQERARSVEEG